MAKEYKISAERLEELKKELDYLKTVKDKEVTEQIKIARGYGDLSENSEYDEAKNEQAKLYSKINEIEDIIANAVVISLDDATSDRIALGSKFTVVEVGGTKETTYELVGSQEANPMKLRVSDDAPFGKAAVGAKVGDIIVVHAPIGEIKYQITNITV